MSILIFLDTLYIDNNYEYFSIVSVIQSTNLWTPAYTPRLPQPRPNDVTPTTAQRTSCSAESWQSSGPPESPVKQECDLSLVQ